MPREDIESTRAGEYGVALELLTTQIAEHDIQVTPGRYSEIVQLGTVMGLDDSYWTGLKPKDNR